MRDMAELAPMMQRPIYLHDGSETHSQAKELLNRTVECYFAREPMWNTQCYSYLMQLYACWAAAICAPPPSPGRPCAGISIPPS